MMLPEATNTKEHTPERRRDRALPFLVAAVYLISFLLPLPALDAFPLSLCAFRNATGLPCPGCGMTHAFLALGHGQPALAWKYNALAVPMFFFGLAWLAREVAMLAGRPRWPVVPARVSTRLTILFVVVLMLYGAFRLAVPEARPYGY